MKSRLNMLFIVFLFLTVFISCGVKSKPSQNPPVQLSSEESLEEKYIPLDKTNNAETEADFSNSIDLCGGWHKGPVVGSGYSTRYLFMDTGEFYFAESEMPHSFRLLYMDGEWTFEDGLLQLTIKRKIVIEGGALELEKGYDIPFSVVKGGERVKISLEPNHYEQLEYKVELINEILPEDNGHKSILLNGRKFWANPGVDYDEMLSMWNRKWEKDS